MSFTKGGADLSGREEEVADLVGAGRTNDEIAQELYLSRRTVESHLERIRHKLDLSSRYAVMAWALGRRLESERRGEDSV